MLEGFFGVSASVRASVAAQYRGRVVFRVETDAEQMSFGVERGIGGQQLIQVGEVTAHQRTELGGGAAGIDKRQHQNLAAKLLQ